MANFVVTRHSDESIEAFMARFKTENKKAKVNRQCRDKEFFMSKKEKSKLKSDRHKAMLQAKKKKNRRG